jgi:hypothetical protein
MERYETGQELASSWLRAKWAGASLLAKALFAVQFSYPVLELGWKPLFELSKNSTSSTKQRS